MCVTCPDGTFLSGQTCQSKSTNSVVLCLFCLDCNAKCATCTSATVCQSCNPGYGLSSGATMCNTCSGGTYSNGQLCTGNLSQNFNVNFSMSYQLSDMHGLSILSNMLNGKRNI